MSFVAYLGSSRPKVCSHTLDKKINSISNCKIQVVWDGYSRYQCFQLLTSDSSCKPLFYKNGHMWPFPVAYKDLYKGLHGRCSACTQYLMMVRCFKMSIDVTIFDSILAVHI